jgi:predicted Zn-dependent peptidase
MTYEDDVKKITAAKIQDAAKEYFNFDKSTTMILKKAQK